ncbi:quinate/shikimate dehydrogenase [Corynebacterium glutamicum MT]|uniref:Shikimate dehydrogenase (NADP(+)) n=1 Tax=Corynebacterium glutamicum TaxID=1718 RepID=A0AB36I8F5_CORGT|nr:quinate/shikimate dehydrogenase (NAD+) [Corynebacterium glutamicum]AGN18084.1 quinate/shikimate dehydrogenase [Corynebacterium glutamicum SCgG1]AGN21107.1 quinate/shikimate dehydrogenase [Corynebacterium glutamicum SCgG2]EGV41012.1 quinate/shikimate dehydrogenase [Corynebacterium glutamicum S9114]EOA64183.1 quinate/shikimate dehydrogenase [Corynebacterium glutamicum MT]EPP41826.1 quinate/shikimate dehydrogenase [Corynebacterium glutamicum Z188]
MNDSILLGLIGQGLDLSRTPAMHEAEGLAQGRATVYRRIDTLGSRASGQDLKTLLDAALYLGFNGLNITHPYKQAVLPLLDEVSEQATQLGAVNTVVIDADGHTTGHNTDVSGFGRGMEEGLPNAKLDSVVQVGAGGVGNAVAYALVTHGVQKLQVADLDTSRAQALADVINNAVGREAVVGVDARGIEDVIAAADGVVNATPMGMPAHPGTAFDVSCLTKDHWVGDVVYMPIETELLKAARDLGCETLDGTRMAIHQAVDAFRLFTGLEPDVSRMRETFLSL